MVMGAHAPELARNKKNNNKIRRRRRRRISGAAAIAITIAACFWLVDIAMAEESGANSTGSAALLKFKEGLGNNSALYNWNPIFPPCEWDRSNWIGVLCLNGSIWGLRLEQKSLYGAIDVDALATLPSFRTLSLMDNQFTGPLPSINKLGKLKALYLSNNMFSGNVPANAFQGMGSLKRVFMANNMFTGDIPLSLATLPRLIELRLEGNQFRGPIPAFQQSLRALNLASNELVGPIPSSLSNFSADAFSGNKDLCGPPLDPCGQSSNNSNSYIYNTNNRKSHVNIIIIIIIILAVLIILAAAAVATLCRHRKRKRRSGSSQIERTSSLSANSNKIVPNTYARDREQIPMAGEGSTHSRRSDKLAFVRDDVDRFDMNDLLTASAEVLGSGTFGSSYKASVGSSQPFVVKRYRHMNNVTKEEFHEHMRRLGRLNHPNLLQLVAFYYRREEKLLVYEFVENGSLASHLHGNRSLEGGGLDWQTRLRIIKGVAKGLAYLYRELPMLVPYGHLKSSNVLLDPSLEPLLTDYALRPVINPQQAHNLMIAYKSPEYAQKGRTSSKTDVWSFGILVLEMLTGKFPENYLTPGYDSSASLASWVNQMVKERRTSEVFDRDMKGTKNSKGEMINVLKIGLSCCEEDPVRRLDIKQVIEKLEQLKQTDGGSGSDDYHASSFTIRESRDDFSDR